MTPTDAREITKTAFGPSTARSVINKLADQVEALTKERDALAVDAARYRWLRSSRHNDATVMTYVDGLDDWVAWADGEDVDTSVDKALHQAGVK